MLTCTTPRNNYAFVRATVVIPAKQNIVVSVPPKNDISVVSSNNNSTAAPPGAAAVQPVDPAPRSAASDAEDEESRMLREQSMKLAPRCVLLVFNCIIPEQPSEAASRILQSYLWRSRVVAPICLPYGRLEFNSDQ